MSEFMSPNIDNENQALWTPGKREVYKHYEAPRTRADQEQREEELYALREEYQRSIESYINAAFERGVGLAQYGAAMGKSMIRIYQTTGDIGSPDSPQYHRMMQRL